MPANIRQQNVAVSPPTGAEAGSPRREPRKIDVSNSIQALKDVSLAVPQGILGLLGPKAPGKSTLMRIIATLQEPDPAQRIQCLH